LGKPQAVISEEALALRNANRTGEEISVSTRPKSKQRARSKDPVNIYGMMLNNSITIISCPVTVKLPPTHASLIHARLDFFFFYHAFSDLQLSSVASDNVNLDINILKLNDCMMDLILENKIHSFWSLSSL